jgi:hypothetical protein
MSLSLRVAPRRYARTALFRCGNLVLRAIECYMRLPRRRAPRNDMQINKKRIQMDALFVSVYLLRA